MQTRQVKKWGNGLAVRIPKAYAEEAHLKDGTAVSISVRHGKLVIEPAEKVSLDKLLAGIKPGNLHGETDTGEAVGAEVW